MSAFGLRAVSVGYALTFYRHGPSSMRLDLFTVCRSGDCKCAERGSFTHVRRICRTSSAGDLKRRWAHVGAGATAFKPNEPYLVSLGSLKLQIYFEGALDFELTNQPMQIPR